MPKLSQFCRTVTTFSVNGALDEEAFRQQLRRLIDAKIGVYLASGGSGESYAMSLDEIRRVYEIGVEECQGKVPVYANPPEQHTAGGVLLHSRLAIEAGCEAVNIYPIASWHGMRPTESELRAYYDTILPAFPHPVAIAINPVLGYVPPARLMAEVIDKYQQVVAVNLTFASNETYLVNLKDRVSREMPYYVTLLGCLSGFALGASGITSPHANIIPGSFQRFIELAEQGRSEELATLYSGILRFVQLVERWQPGGARWEKMAMKVLKLPGGEGGLRPPYAMPAADELQALADGLLRVGLPEVDTMAQAAGLRAH